VLYSFFVLPCIKKIEGLFREKIRFFLLKKRENSIKLLIRKLHLGGSCHVFDSRFFS